MFLLHACSFTLPFDPWEDLIWTLDFEQSWSMGCSDLMGTAACSGHLHHNCPPACIVKLCFLFKKFTFSHSFLTYPGIHVFRCGLTYPLPVVGGTSKVEE